MLRGGEVGRAVCFRLLVLYERCAGRTRGAESLKGSAVLGVGDDTHWLAFSHLVPRTALHKGW